MDYKDENTWLMLGDCLERMKEIPSGSIDAIISDAPYGIDFSQWDVLHNNKNSALLGQSPANRKSSIFKTRGKPLNGWSQEDRDKGMEIQQWVCKWMCELYRICKPCSPMLLFTGRQYSHKFICAGEDAGFILKDTLSWDKGSAAFRAQRVNCVLQQRGLAAVEEGDWRLGNPAPRVEPILYMFKPYPIGTTVTDQFIDSGLGCFNAESVTSNLINVQSKIREKVHETQKPVELMELLVKMVTLPSHTIIDPFMGSGTTGVACKNLNRKFVGVETDEKYFTTSKERILKGSV